MSSEKNCVSKLEKQNDCKVYSLLDLPEWTLDCILECLSAQDLFRVAQVCTSLRDKTRTDALWEKLINQKWGSLLGEAVYQEWQWHTTKIANTQIIFSLHQNQSGSCGSFTGVWPFLNFHSYLENFIDFITLFKHSSKMALYICLESGRFWFPAQMYKTSKLFCYDVIVSYDSKRDTFKARSQTCGWRMTEQNIEWDMLRSPPTDTSPREVHMSNCMNDLKPGDQIEIQMKKRKESPFYWCYAVIGHLETCNQNVNHCRCQYDDNLVVEFKQYPAYSRNKRSVLNRNRYEEQVSMLSWFGGIRKLDKEEEIEKWNNLFASR
ncbi:F-box protein At2g41170-like [Vigna radiata var. radiata]|uniref:F-box protein At2g41170-like n=1 Tax=Vigna radiata var. radiata TaxID=3916 RepID=A0A1S3TB97_VIGRR|nr:F-box protein At2g41170-like [Vigna radiata var. radiata]